MLKHDHREGVRVMKRAWILIVMLMFMISTAGSGTADVEFAPRVYAESKASAALLEKYGITGGMQTYFSWEYLDEGNGKESVLAYGIGPLNYVLGNYTVTLQNGEVQSVTWTHDGESTEGMFESEAWGSRQMEAMLEEISATFDTMDIFSVAADIAQKYDWVDGPVQSSRILGNDVTALDPDAFHARNMEVFSQAKLSMEEYESIGKETIQTLYLLTESQARNLVEESYEDYANLYGAYLDGTPVIIVWFGIGYGEEEHGWMEGDGTYTVAMDAATGRVLATEYESGLSANG